MSIEKFTENELWSLKMKIVQFCPYGLTHFCDGKTNKSEAPEGTIDKTPCSLNGDLCPIKMYSVR